jgi:hypothetical protein
MSEAPNPPQFLSYEHQTNSWHLGGVPVPPGTLLEVWLGKHWHTAVLTLLGDTWLIIGLPCGVSRNPVLRPVRLLEEATTQQVTVRHLRPATASAESRAPKARTTVRVKR